MPGFTDFMGGGQPVNFQQASSFQQTLNPQQAAPQQTPPSTPQELEQRKQGWQGFIEGLQKDPALRTAAFMTAAQMMRGPDMGESMAGGIGRALQLGTLAHSFMSSNQARQQMEQQKMAEQSRLNEANIAQTQANTTQTQAQTRGLEQTQGFEAEDRPLARRSKELKNSSDEFTVANQPTLLNDQLANSASERQYRSDHGAYFKDKKNTPGASAQVALDREDKLIRTANPPMDGETEQAYEQRIAQLSLGRGQKNIDSVRVQAAQNILNNSDPGTPEYNDALAVMQQVSTGGQPAPATDDQAAWAKSRNSVKPGEAYTGPNGKTYIRKD